MSVALVTGSGRGGMGRAHWRSPWRAKGYDRLSASSRLRRPRRIALAAQIRLLGRRAITVSADLGDATDAAELVARCAGLGAITCLVNNAALYERDDVLSLSADALDRHHAVNLRAPVLLAQAMAAALTAGQAGQAGQVINMLDFHVAALTPRFFSYGVSKAALAAATEMLAIGLAPAVRVNAIAPGLVLASPFEDGERFDRLRDGTLLGFGVEVDDIVAALRYLLASRAVTGQVIHVDAGQRLISRRNPK